MGKISAWLMGIGLGAGLMYYMDPQMGNQRKSKVRNQMLRLQNQADDAVETAVHDTRNRVKGLLSRGIEIVSDEALPDAVLEQRARARLGFLTRAPGALQLQVDQGELTIDGDILAEDAEELVNALGRLRGIRAVRNNLRLHADDSDLPMLQKQSPLDRNTMMWSPTRRLLSGVGAGYLLLYGVARGGIIGMIARLAGMGLGLRALTNMDMRTMAGKNPDADLIQLRKSIQIYAPVDEVYQLWSKFENFSRFMANIDSIEDLGDGRSHWVVKGPAGSKVEFDARLTDNVPNERVAWETLPDSTVQHRGSVNFRETDRGTQVNVNMVYNPPAGVAGHAVAKLFGKDPKTEMDADLQRLKNLLERGETRADGQKINREEILPESKKRSRQRNNGEENQQNQSQPAQTNMGGMGGGPLNSSDF